MRDADVVITCTAAREPLVERGWLKPGAHVTAVGSDGPDKQELDPAILEAADLLVVDSRDQCLRLGELQHAPGQADRAVELGTICAGSARAAPTPPSSRSATSPAWASRTWPPRTW